MDGSLPSSAECLPTGAWGSVPDCEIISCPLPTVGQHMSVEISSMTYLGTLNYSCSVAYGIVSGEGQHSVSIGMI